MTERLAVVCGGGGFIGGHLVARLLSEGWRVRAIDMKPLDQWWQRFDGAENCQLDLRLKEACVEAVGGGDVVYNLAAEMGGMGFIEKNRAVCMLSVLINTHLLLASRDAGVARFFYASSACVYNADRQRDTDVPALTEADAYPAMPEDGYGWEKLFGERMCRHFMEDFGLTTRVARFHNVYGPYGAWAGGREKAPAAICRKIIEAKCRGQHEMEIWGTGEQTRSFQYIDDCIHGMRLIMDSDVREPLNLGSDERVSIDQLVDLVEDIAGIKVKRTYRPDAPTGVNGRNSDNTRIKETLGWAPSTRLRNGLHTTYAWIHDQIVNNRPCPTY